MWSIAGIILLTAVLFLPPTASSQPLTLSLQCPEHDCPLLVGAPQTTGMRSGFVRLKPGETVGWHTTGQNEEALVIIHGKGAALVDGYPNQNFHAPALAYIPPAARHNVQNTGKGVLEYVYVVAPAKPQQ